MSFRQPITLDECEARLATLSGEESLILAQLNDPVRMQQMDALRYAQWKSATLQRKAIIIRERKLLAAWRQSTLRQDAEKRKQEKEQRLRAQQERDNQVYATRESAGGGDLLLLQLFLVSARIVKKTAIDLSSHEFDTIAQAKDYLISMGLLGP